jgi:peroxiredoxin
MRSAAGLLAASSVILALGAPTPSAAQSAGKFTLDPQGTKSTRLGYFPIPVKLSETKPAGVRKEPAYSGKPKYGVFQVGDGPKSTHYLALDEPENGTWKIYVDVKGDGDLTSSGDGAWSKRNDTNGRVMYGVNPYAVRGSWGTAKKEKSSGSYGVAFYRFVGRDVIFMYREAARLGTVTVDGKSHKALLVENDADGVYSKPLDDDGKPVTGGPTHPVWLMIDMKDDGKWGPQIDIRGPFKLGEKNYVADVAPDGSRLKLAITTRKVIEPATQPSKPLLAVGTTAPDFEAEAWGGGSLHLADYRGKVVVLDFWATWCGPCQLSMPHIEKVYQAVKDKGVVVLGVCVYDEKAAYQKWIPEKRDTYHFTFAYDPAGRSDKSIAGAKYNADSIPTTYIIDRDGKVAAALVGYEEGDKRVEEALSKLGVPTRL